MLTDAGRELYPVILTLMQWGDRHLARDDAPPLLVEHVCGDLLDPALVCRDCGAEVDPRQVVTRSCGPTRRYRPRMPDTSWGEPRSKTVEWYDPMATAEAGRRLSGLAYLQAMIDGQIAPPPIAELMGFSVVEVAAGEVVFRCTPDESVYNPIGAVHGGLVCTLLDSVCGCAVQSTLELGTAYTSLEIKVSYLRPVTAATGELTARGWVTRRGRRASFADGDVRDAAGKVVATASSTCLVFPLPTS